MRRSPSVLISLQTAAAAAHAALCCILSNVFAMLAAGLCRHTKDANVGALHLKVVKLIFEKNHLHLLYDPIEKLCYCRPLTNVSPLRYGVLRGYRRNGTPEDDLSGSPNRLG